MQIPSTAVLRSFEAAAKAQSFTSAAEILGISQAVVSRQVKEFEALIGTPLFRKEGRGVVLTPAGQTLSANLHADLAALRRTIADARAAGETGQSLRIAILPTFGSRWLMPRLARFRAQHPGVTLSFESHTRPFDLAKAGVDAAIHFGSSDWVGGRAIRLCPEDLIVVASPALIAQSEAAGGVDYTTLPRLHLTSRAELWPAFFKSQNVAVESATVGDRFDQFSAMIAATVHGLGAAIVPAYLVETELAQRTLRKIGQAPSGPGQYYVVRPLGLRNATAIAFCEWVRAEAAASRRLRAHAGELPG